MGQRRVCAPDSIPGGQSAEELEDRLPFIEQSVREDVEWTGTEGGRSCCGTVSLTGKGLALAIVLYGALFLPTKLPLD